MRCWSSCQSRTQSCRPVEQSSLVRCRKQFGTSANRPPVGPTWRSGASARRAKQPTQSSTHRTHPPPQPCRSPLVAPRNPTLGILHTKPTHTRPCHITASEPCAFGHQATSRRAAYRSSTGTRIRHFHLPRRRLFCGHHSRTTPRHGLFRRERCARVPPTKIRSLPGGRDKRGGRRATQASRQGGLQSSASALAVAAAT